MPRLVHRYPQYRLHRASGQAVVTLEGRDRYLGPFDSPASRNLYDRLLGEWLLQGHVPAVATRPSPTQPGGLSVAEVLMRFLRHARVYYRRPDGSAGSEFGNFRDALRPVQHLYEVVPAAAFGPLALQNVRQKMIGRWWCRSHVNKQVRRVKQVFRWAAENELLSASVYHALQSVGGMRAGRWEAREAPPVRPVVESHVESVIPFMSRHVPRADDPNVIRLCPGIHQQSVDLMSGQTLYLASGAVLYGCVNASTCGTPRT